MASRPKGPRAKPLTAYRIADSRHPIFDGAGALLIGGRWNSSGCPVIYAAASYAGAMLERLVHAGTGRIPKNQKAIVITIPARVSREEWAADQLSQGWDSEDNIASRAFGDTWLHQKRSAVLLVPSVIAKYEKNVLINPAHPDFKWIVASSPQEVIWDARLFKRRRK
jgi:RES domain-containing protein